MSADLLRLPDGRQAQYWQGGSESGPVVFFLHGCPDTRHAAFPGDEAAQRTGVRLISVNRPGYGWSDEAAATHGSVADDVAAVADLLGIERYAVLGMSIGGPYALACAVRHPGRVTAAGVVASPAILTELDPPIHRDDLSADEQEYFADFARRSVEDTIELARPEFEAYVESLAPGDPDDEALVRRFTERVSSLDAEVLARLTPSELAGSVREALINPNGYLRDAAITFRAWDFDPSEISCPTTFWYGELDANASVRNGEWFAASIPGARLVVREGAGHLGSLHDHWEDILGTLRG